jgi:hypothetical protein
METYILYAVLCTGFGDSQSCTAHELVQNLSSADCDHYFTDTGIQEAEVMMYWYVPNYQGHQVILSCDKVITNNG